MKKQYPAIAKQIMLLQTCLAGNFENNTLEKNRQLLIDLEELQTTTFDQRQRYGNPNYHEMPIEEELSDMSVKLRTIIASQMMTALYKTASLENLITEFEYLSRLDNHSPCYHDLHRDETEDEAADKAKDHVGRIIFNLCIKGLEQKRLPKSDKELFLKSLKNVRDHYNGGTDFYKEVEKILTPYKSKQELERERV